MILTRRSRKTTTGRLWRQGKIRFMVKSLSLKGGEPICGAGSKARLKSFPQIDTGGIEVRLMSGERLLESR